MFKNLPVDVQRVAFALNRDGYQAHLVGGAVRDILFGKTPKDFDVATDATPDVVKNVMLEYAPLVSVHSVGTGERHGTVVVSGVDGLDVEVTTFRKDVNCDGRHAEVEFSRFLAEDLNRRDFTINAMAWNLDPRVPRGDRLVDLHYGRVDVKRNLVMSVGRASDRFREDWLRMLRACRFCALNDKMKLANSTATAIRLLAPNVAEVAPERMFQELLKLMSYPKPSRGLRAMEATGLLEFVLPEVAPLVGLEQNRWHDLYGCEECGDVFQKIVDPEFVGFHRIGK